MPIGLHTREAAVVTYNDTTMLCLAGLHLTFYSHNLSFNQRFQSRLHRVHYAQQCAKAQPRCFPHNLKT